jgi:hypothetical protein
MLRNNTTSFIQVMRISCLGTILRVLYRVMRISCFGTILRVLYRVMWISCFGKILWVLCKVMGNSCTNYPRCGRRCYVTHVLRRLVFMIQVTTKYSHVFLGSAVTIHYSLSVCAQDTVHVRGQVWSNDHGTHIRLTLGTCEQLSWYCCTGIRATFSWWTSSRRKFFRRTVVTSPWDRNVHLRHTWI